ncbi:MAG: substrate-binding domain-containing protein [Epulopiscium sp.]|nr:substrate-binding domain-containing protein [Candidatus Epulonipiscium sp.]
MKKNITMKDIAKRLNVSNVTVSKALNNKEGVSEELRNKIVALAEEMGYRYNTMAKGMKEGYSYNIGVLIAERFIGEHQSFYLNFFQHISKALEAYQYYGILQIVSETDEKQGGLPRVYYENKIDGFIVLGQISKSYCEKIKSVNMPMIFLDFYDDSTDVDYVIMDNFYASYEITNYLMRCGHKKIAFVGNVYATSSIQDRFLGYYKSLLENGSKLKEEYIINDRDEQGRLINLEIPKEFPTAFVCNCDQVAYNLIQALNEKGYNIPDDCSVVGFDNDIYAIISHPKLTTIQVDIENMARTVARLIVKKVKNPDRKYGRILVNGKIVHRDSVKVINKE